MRIAKITLMALLMPVFSLGILAQSETHSPRSSATTALTLQDLSTLKKRDANETFPVMTTNGNSVATFVNIVLDQQSGQPRFAVLNLFENVAEKRPFTLVPWELLKLDKASGDIIVQTSVDTLRKAPTVQPKEVKTKVEQGYGEQFYAHYGLKPSQASTGAGSSMLPAGTIKGSGGDNGDPGTVGNGFRVFLFTALGAVALIGIVFALNRRRISDPK